MFRNIGWLLAGKGVGAALSLVYLGLAARTLGAERFGQFSLIFGTAQAVATLVSFQTWQIVVRFGMSHLHEGRHDALARLTGFCAGLDMLSALAGCAIVLTGAALFGSWLAWPGNLSLAGLAFCLVALLSVRSTPVGVLRLHDRFDIGAAADATTPVMRFAGAIAVVAAGASVSGFLLAWALAEIVTAAVYWTCAGRVAPGVLALPRPRTFRAAASENPGLWRLSWLTNLNDTLETGGKQMVVLLVGLVAGAAGAGQYRLAAQLSQALARISEMVSRAVLAELSRANAGSGDDFGRLLRQATWITLLASVVVVGILALAGRPLLSLIAGPGYGESYPLLLLLGLGAALDLAGAGFEPALIARGFPGKAFWARLSGLVCLALALACLLPWFGAKGAGAAVLLSSCASLLLFGLMAFRLTGRGRS